MGPTDGDQDALLMFERVPELAYGFRQINASGYPYGRRQIPAWPKTPPHMVELS